MNLSSAVVTGCLVGFCCCLAGCVSEPVTKPRQPLPRDACSDKLQEWAERVLRFHFAQRRLPASVDELLASERGLLPADLVCPHSNTPYVFEPQGLRSPGLDGRILLHDAAGTHAGFRWGLLVRAPAGNQPLTARVIALTEK